MDFSLKKVVSFIIAIFIAIAIAAVLNSQFTGFEDAFANLVR
jgi:hypothetical protein